MSRRISSALGAVMAATLSGIIPTCSKESHNAPSQPRPSARDSVHWTGTAAVYDTSIIKNDRSVIFFLASWCGWCNKLKNETLKDSTVIRILNESFNAVAIDPDADTQVVYFDTTVSARDLCNDIYSVHAFPTIYFFDRAGTAISSTAGYRDASTFANQLIAIRDYQPPIGTAVFGSPSTAGRNYHREKPLGSPSVSSYP